jgi:hypothetical protein
VPRLYLTRRGKTVPGLQHPEETTWRKLGRGTVRFGLLLHIHRDTMVGRFVTTCADPAEKGLRVNESANQRLFAVKPRSATRGRTA